MILVTFSRDWADEFNCDGFRIFKTEEEWDEVREGIENTNSFYFGTNEGWEDEDDMIESYVVKEITTAEYAALARLFPAAATEDGYGIFPLGNSDELWDDNDDED